MTIRRLQGWACVVVGAVVLAGCNAVASESEAAQASAALAATPHGGVLGCTARKHLVPFGGNRLVSRLFLANYNDAATISVDRIDAYSMNGTKLPCNFSPVVVEPHQLSADTPLADACIPVSSDWAEGPFTLIVYWSYAQPPVPGAMRYTNPLVGWIEKAVLDQAGAVVRAWDSLECKAISLER
jgi:hypothetical protein